MAYTIHIHRREKLRNGPVAGDIALEDVRALAAKYPHLEFIEARERVGLNMCCGGETRWTEENILMGFQFSDGTLRADYVDTETILRALYIAALLGAKVHGDDGETYRATEDGFEHTRD